MEKRLLAQGRRDRVGRTRDSRGAAAATAADLRDRAIRTTITPRKDAEAACTRRTKSSRRSNAELGQFAYVA